MQESLFRQARREPKAVRETSREALREIKPTIKGRQLVVLSALRAYNMNHINEPTSSDLMAYMRVTDPNMVRPRLTELRKSGYVEACDARRCGITGKKAHTWRVTPRGEAYLREQK